MTQLNKPRTLMEFHNFHGSSSSSDILMSDWTSSLIASRYKRAATILPSCLRSFAKTLKLYHCKRICMWFTSSKNDAMLFAITPEYQLAWQMLGDVESQCSKFGSRMLKLHILEVDTHARVTFL